MIEDKKMLQVKRFCEIFNQPVLDTPQIPSERWALRLRLIKEEVQELEDAIAQGDLIEVADAFCDIQYVLNGAILEFGMGEIFEGMCRAVHNSNMSKVCKSEEEAKATVESYTEQGIQTEYQRLDFEDGTVFTILRSSDKKALKSIHYQPVQLGKFLGLPEKQ